MLNSVAKLSMMSASYFRILHHYT